MNGQNARNLKAHLTRFAFLSDTPPVPVDVAESPIPVSSIENRI